MNALARNTATPAQTVSSELCEQFVSYLDVAPRTAETYAKALRRFFCYLSARGIKNPVRDDIIAFRDDLKSTHKPATVSIYITAVKLFFQWTAQEGYYPNIADHVKGAKLTRDHKKDYLTGHQVRAVLDNMHDTTSESGARDYAIITLMVTCGLRDIEVHQANICDLRPRGGNVVLYIQGKGRNEKSEYVKIAPEVEKAVRDYLKVRNVKSDNEPLFVSLSNNSNGKRITTRSISAIVKNRLKAAGYDSPRLTAHSLRHTAVTLSLLGGRDITEVQQFARHRSITTTMIYNHAVDCEKNRCAETIARALWR